MLQQIEITQAAGLTISSVVVSKFEHELLVVFSTGQFAIAQAQIAEDDEGCLLLGLNPLNINSYRPEDLLHAIGGEAFEELAEERRLRIARIAIQKAVEERAMYERLRAKYGDDKGGGP